MVSKLEDAVQLTCPLLTLANAIQGTGRPVRGHTHCLGPECACWRESTAQVCEQVNSPLRTIKGGYCGLAGRPQGWSR